MFEAIEHVALVADDPSALATWYQDVLGFRLIRSSEAAQSYFLDLPGGGVLEILPSDGSEPVHRGHDSQGIHHIALGVDDFDAALGQLQQADIALAGPPRRAADGTRLGFFTDPEGNLLQLVYRPTPLR